MNGLDFIKEYTKKDVIKKGFYTISDLGKLLDLNYTQVKSYLVRQAQRVYCRLRKKQG